MTHRPLATIAALNRILMHASVEELRAMLAETDGSMLGLRERIGRVAWRAGRWVDVEITGEGLIRRAREGRT